MIVLAVGRCGRRGERRDGGCFGLSFEHAGVLDELKQFGAKIRAERRKSAAQGGLVGDTRRPKTSRMFPRVDVEFCWSAPTASAERASVSTVLLSPLAVECDASYSRLWAKAHDAGHSTGLSCSDVTAISGL